MTVALAGIVEALSRAGLVVSLDGSLPVEITAVTDDSRRVVPGALFLAVRGATADGHNYLNDAEAAGAAAAVVEVEGRTTLPAIRVNDGRAAAAIAAAAFHGWPATSLRLLAVTGTSGKSTTVAMLRHMFDEPPGSSASIGTLGVLRGSAGAPLADIGGLTTPGPIELQRVLRALVDAGITRLMLGVPTLDLAHL
ncbi:MAG: Mur ligase domain-containing protein, partial [Gemmatimonadaceae bacterium]